MTEGQQSAAEYLFRVRDDGSDLETLASRSLTEFVRTQYQLGVANPTSTGYRMSSLEALHEYGWDILSEAADHGSAILVESDGEPYRALKDRANALGLRMHKLFADASWSASDADDFANERPIPFRKLDRLASLLGIESKNIGKSDAGGMDSVGARLRTLIADREQELTEDIVIAISEASRLIADYVAIRRLLGDSLVSNYYITDYSSIYKQIDDVKIGLRNYEPWQVGFQCADLVRKFLSIEEDDPVRGLATIVERSFDIFLLQTRSPGDFSGCSVERAGERAILLNRAFRGGNVFVMRAALAHELGHCLMDTASELANVHVDQDRVFDSNVFEHDAVESRANAFAVQLLAPRNSVVREYDRRGSGDHSVRAVMEIYGVSQSIVTRQISNSYGIDHSQVTTGRNFPRSFSVAKWEKLERSIFDDLSELSREIAPIRLSKLAILGSLAYSSGYISADKLSSLLGCNQIEVGRTANGILRSRPTSRLYTLANGSAQS